RAGDSQRQGGDRGPLGCSLGALRRPRRTERRPVDSGVLHKQRGARAAGRSFKGKASMSPLEPDLPGVRRLEAPVMVDRRGTVWVLGLIDVTVRYGGRTVLAEAPPPGL